MDPFRSGYVMHLPVLTMIEELFIAKVFVVMQMYRISSSGSVGYKGHCLNVQKDLEQPTTAWCRVLPWLPNKLPIVIIKFQRDNLPTGTKLFKVNVISIRVWLEFLKANHPAYADICIDVRCFRNLSQLTDENGNVDIITQLTHVVENDTVSNDHSGNDNNNDDDISNYIEHEIENGPEQGGATSDVVKENSEILQEGTLYVPADQVYDDSEESLITHIVANRLGTTNSQPLLFNIDGHNLNDFSTPGIQSLTFPTLFPYYATTL